MSSLHAALEVGTTRTVLAIGEVESDGRLKVVCHAEIPSTGVRKSQILDIDQATSSIRTVLREIEKKQAEAGISVEIGNAFLVISGQHIKADPFQGMVPIEGAKVGQDAIDEVMRSSRTMQLPNEREFLDIVDRDYEVDTLGGISAPRGMSGRILKLNTLQIHADRNRVNDARTAADAAKLEIRDPLFAATCAAEAVLADYERKNGVLVLDVGGGSTGYAAYSDGHLAATGVIGVGGDHVTNDIAHAFQTTNAQAEQIKRAEASALIGGESGSPRVKIPGSSPLIESRTISRHALDTVVNARLGELFAIIRETLEEQDLFNRFHAGVVLTGGGAEMRNLDKLAARELGMAARIGSPANVDGLEGERFPAAYAAISGALLYASRNYEDKSVLGSLFKRFFSK